MKPSKIEAGSLFPQIKAHSLEGEMVALDRRTNGADWKMVVVYRGKHCPLCTKYLNKLEAFKDELNSIGVEIVAVSGDSEAQLKEHFEKLDVSFPFLYGLTIEQMRELGLYVSHPRSEKETDHPFPEPGLFVINDKDQVQVVDISNNPFVRPALEQLVSGLKWIKNPENNYPIRGTYH
ncbi:MAG: redoxin family protein [Arenicellales bacterium]|nr:redoxin family protein [Arenicellales bacterium]